MTDPAGCLLSQLKQVKSSQYKFPTGCSFASNGPIGNMFGIKSGAKGSSS